MAELAASRTIGDIARQAAVPPTTLRYYEKLGLIAPTARVGGQRRYDHAVLGRLEVIRLCKSAGFTLDEIQILYADDLPGRPASRALAEAKLAEIDSRMTELARAREIVEWGMRCTCPSIDACTCGVHSPLVQTAEPRSAIRGPDRAKADPRQCSDTGAAENRGGSGGSRHSDDREDQ
jgi:MerR family transcriptional regulator, redox-sensitive transcriptional activator SoxR